MCYKGNKRLINNKTVPLKQFNQINYSLRLKQNQELLWQSTGFNSSTDSKMSGFQPLLSAMTIFGIIVLQAWCAPSKVL